ncbi:hypothetical protein V2J09_002647 [Rumex salicifolius]
MIHEFRTLNQLFMFSVAVILLLPLPYSTQAIDKSAKAKFYEMPDGLGTPSGACGYGEYGRNLSNGNVAAVSSRLLYKSGAGCGACYQVKCKVADCNNGGVKVVVTDNSSANETEFILSYRAFASMAKPGKEKALREKGVVDVQYKRIRCDYGAGKSLRVQVLDHSTYPYYLAFMFLYQGGSSPITAVEIFEKESIEWKQCSRAYGAVWQISSPPKTTLTMRLFLPESKSTWILLPSVIPNPWTPGVSYDTYVRIP